MGASKVPLQDVRAMAFTVPTDQPEADGTFAWTSTTLVVVEVEGGGKTGLGYTYSHACLVDLIESMLADAVRDVDALDPPAAWAAMQYQVRNVGRGGLAACAISAVDAAVWDLKAKLLDLPLATLLGRLRDHVSVYGSGGFTTYDDDTLRRQLAGWVERDGCASVKMKVGSHPADDLRRVSVAKSAIGDADLFVDANGAFSANQARRCAETFADYDVRWFEEPTTSDDLEGLNLVRRHAPAGMDIAAGEYGFTVDYFERMLSAKAVDCQQADLTRCGGVTAFMQVGALCQAHHLDLSGHCAPAIHLHAACAAPRVRHLEWFHDHVRIEDMLFDGAPRVRSGSIAPDLSRPGHGLELRRADAERYAASRGSS